MVIIYLMRYDANYESNAMSLWNCVALQTNKFLVKHHYQMNKKWDLICCGVLQQKCKYRQTSNIRHTLVGNKIVDDSDVVGGSPISTAPINIFILDLTPGFNGLRKDNCKMSRGIFKFWHLVCLILEI